MKKLYCLVMAAVTFCCTSCINLNLSELKKLEPSDNIVKNEYKMEAFSKVDIDVVAKVKIMQGPRDDYRVLLKCPDNYVDFFEFKVDGDKLKVGFAKNMHGSIESRDVAIVVCCPVLKSLENSGVSNIIIDSLKTPSLRIDSEGVGNINIQGLVTETLDVESSGVGNIVLKGEAKTVSIDCSGVGNIKAEELKAVNVEADVSGVGSITCFASEQIDGKVMGVGSLRYAGHPQQKKLKAEGVGKITELD